MAALAEYVADWAPGPVEETDRIGAWAVQAFADLLDRPAPAGDGVLPPLWHRFSFLERAAQHELGEDGHVRESHFLPPIPDRRRMFAGGRLEWHAPVGVGDEVVRRSAIASMTPKSGRSGEMLFVTLRHEFRRGGVLLLTEEEDLVYRQQKPGEGRRVEAAVAAEPGPHTADGPWTARLQPDEVMLFRFSALTYNAHRIHHDFPYVTRVEGFPGLV
ncbi:FAS1-like dehydratase domain-containing protein, partial [Pseudonocardia sp.]